MLALFNYFIRIFSKDIDEKTAKGYNKKTNNCNSIKTYDNHRILRAGIFFARKSAF